MLSKWIPVCIYLINLNKYDIVFTSLIVHCVDCVLQWTHSAFWCASKKKCSSQKENESSRLRQIYSSISKTWQPLLALFISTFINTLFAYSFYYEPAVHISVVLKLFTLSNKANYTQLEPTACFQFNLVSPTIRLHMKGPSACNSNELTGCVHKEKYLTIQ